MNLDVAASALERMEITRKITIRAPIESAFRALLGQLGPENTGRFGQPMPMVLEARPGGRWYRDLGGDDGHFWGHVQAIKRPTLIELCGPLFMSNSSVSNLTYRLEPTEGGTLVRFRHIAHGPLEPEHVEGLETGWDDLLNAARALAESSSTQSPITNGREA